MRIIAGKYKGKIFKAPKSLDVRPTTDRVREAMFSSIISIYGKLDNVSVLDAYAGSGALGFESISRGASHLVAFENNKKNYENLVNNYKLFNEENFDAKFLCADVKNAKFHLLFNNKFDVLFFDPPYKNSPMEVLEILKKIKASNLIAKNALIVYEHSAKFNFADFSESFNIENIKGTNSKTYGDIAIEYLRWVKE